jgi:hypothetical protein
MGDRCFVADERTGITRTGLPREVRNRTIPVYHFSCPSRIEHSYLMHISRKHDNLV